LICQAGKHALGDRARKIDQGILITRFELPFNIWCDSCNNHIGMGVRYNAEKKKIGSYYSTPIFSFRCKCHLCDGWFEIHTDPKNTRYIVVSGARQKDEEWDPEENGGYAVHDTEKGNAGPSDPLAALEKSTDAQNHLKNVQMPRLESLQVVSEHYNSDPYSLSRKVRKRFRAEKKAEKEKEAADEGIKDRYGLPETLSLLQEDDRTKSEAIQEWEKERREFELRENSKRRRLASEGITISTSSTTKLSQSRPGSVQSSGSAVRLGSSSAVSSLRARILENTARRSDSCRKRSQILKRTDSGIVVRK